MEGAEEVNSREYLERIGVDWAVSPDAESLKLLQRQHLLNVPFENLDIHWDRPIILDTERFYRKVVTDRRGGFCYQLNGLFSELLREIGFRTRLVSAKVFNGTDFGREFDHAAVIVTIGELEYLTDVGFGEFSAEPLRIVPDIEQHDREGIFSLHRAEPGSLVAAKKRDGQWVPEYKFSLLGRDLSEFAEMCDFQQYSPESHFTKGKLCSQLTEGGRKTLTDAKYIVTTGGERKETAVGSKGEFYRLLETEFGITRPLTGN